MRIKILFALSIVAQGCKMLHATPKFLLVRSYRVFLYEDQKCTRLTLNVKVNSKEEIFCSVKKLGVVVRSEHLTRKNYHESEVFKLSRLAYQTLLNMLFDEIGQQSLEVEGHLIVIDNRAKNVKIFTEPYK